MYKLLIVDDEDVVREGIANFVPWETYDIQVVGVAWNGVEGLKKMEQLRPDIVLVDIKMPVMDGIEMIKKAKVMFPDVEYVVLSGFGEYEFTSQTMEQGVRYYILKPVDEEKIIAVMEKVKGDLEKRRANAAVAQELKRSAHALLPRAREQVFRDMLLDRASHGTLSTRQLLEELGGADRMILVMGLRLHKGFDYLKRFIVGNMMTDLLPKGTLLMTTGVDRDMYLLIDVRSEDALEQAVNRLRTEFQHFDSEPFIAAASTPAKLSELPKLYRQIHELLHLTGWEHPSGLLRPGLGGGLQKLATAVFDYQAIRQAENYEALLLELYVGFVKMQMKHVSEREKEQICTLMWRLTVLNQPAPRAELPELADALAKNLGFPWKSSKGDQRSRQILLKIYEHLDDPLLSLRWLAQEKLFMSEDHLSRVFTKLLGQKFSSFIECRRIQVAQRLMAFAPDIKISALAELVGYPEDGQYFSKAFRKVSGMPPSEYRNRQ